MWFVEEDGVGCGGNGNERGVMGAKVVYVDFLYVSKG